MFIVASSSRIAIFSLTASCESKSRRVKFTAMHMALATFLDPRENLPHDTEQQGCGDAASGVRV
jgi:hypothetical protein